MSDNRVDNNYSIYHLFSDAHVQQYCMYTVHPDMYSAMIPTTQTICFLTLPFYLPETPPTLPCLSVATPSCLTDVATQSFPTRSIR